MSGARGSSLIFVTGPPRSGTTLVQNMLDSHPRIVGAPEFRHIHHLVGVRNRLHDDIDQGSLDDFFTKAAVDARFSELIESLLLPLAHRFGCEFVSEKTPRNVLVSSDLLDLFPGARFVLVVRDPRAVVASLLRVRERMLSRGITPTGPAATFGAAIGHTREYLAAGFNAKEKDPDRVLDVCYENIVTDPTAETKRICEHVGVAWDEALITPSRFRHGGETAITDASGNVWYTREEFNHDPDPHRVNDWQWSLTGAQKARISRAFSDDRHLALLGYDLSADSLGWFDRARGKLRERGWATGSRFARTRPGGRVKRVVRKGLARW